MKRPYLEITFRAGKAFAAYLYLPRATGAKVARTAKARPGVLVDYDATGRPMGLELTNPPSIDAATVNDVLVELGLSALDPIELAPLRAA
ncbi:MAG: hypothetical protein NVS3B10_09640 [Polyangiales bacterium]